MNRELAALEAVHLSTVPTPDEVWKPVTSYHVEGLHPEVSRRLVGAMNAVRDDQAPAAAVVLGERGAGKTHLLAWTRQEIQARGGFFFYIKLVTGWEFWESATGSLVDSLYRKDAGGREQLLRLLDQLGRQVGLADAVHSAITGDRDVTRADLDAFVHAIQKLDRQVGNEAADTARALVLVASSGEPVETGKAYLALSEVGEDQRKIWGFSSRPRPAQLVLRDLTRVFALVGPLVFAFDQLDNLVAGSEVSAADGSSTRESRAVQRRTDDIATGLMDLREETRRTLVVIACQQNTWRMIASRAAIRSALDRFTVLPELGAIPDEGTAAAIVASRFRPGYATVAFTPTYPTWPIAPAALAEAAHRYTARRLLNQVAAHIASCLDTGAPMVLTSFAQTERTVTPPPIPKPSAASVLEELTALFNKLRTEADDLAPLDKSTEDGLMPALLGAGLRSLVKELGGDERRFEVETDFGGGWALHARLRYILDEGTENEVHWSFRAIAADNPRAAQTRIRNAVVEAGLEKGLSSRRLMLLRNTPYPTGARTEQVKDDFEARGGLPLPIGAADLRTLGALRAMRDGQVPGFEAWLQLARPTTHIEVFATVLSELRELLAASGGDDGLLDDGTTARPDAVEAITPEITVGMTVRGSRPFTVPLLNLRMHTAVVGAAGSGKTVLIKHIVEQIGLRGVSAIVLDPNDDLGRLGDRWPTPPKGWSDQHEREAERYFAEVEVVVWTPGLRRGRALSFHPLPDFGPVLTDEDDFRRLLTSTVAALAPNAGIRGSTARATQQLGVLSRALDRYARNGGRTLAGLVELLAEPPGDIVNSRTNRLAVQMADTLEAAMETDPVLSESGDPADPGVLLKPSRGKSARISVVSFVGLSGDGPARFVSRLQAALFSWFKAHPAGDRPLGGLLVMDEAQNFVPSGAANPSTESTVELIRQIRKYGLGIVLASQAPRGIHNQALGNTANQFIGRLTATAQIAAAQTMAQARNAILDNLGGLGQGTFYAAGEGTSFSRIQVPICLSHHAGPLQEHQVVERAQRVV